MKNIYCSIIAVLLVSCNSLNTEGVMGSGKVTPKIYDVTHFKEIDISVVFDVVIVPSDTEKVIVETDENLQDLVLVENGKDKLIIKMKPLTNITKKTKGKITIYTTGLNKITNTSVGTLENEGVLNSKKMILNNSAVGNVNLKIKSEDLIFNNTGVGNTDLKGNSDNVTIKNSAVGNLDTVDLKSMNLDLQNHAVGNTVVFADKEITINNSAVGKLDVYGNCVIKEINNTAVGKFVKH